jgi:hypothetical protein
MITKLESSICNTAREALLTNAAQSTSSCLMASLIQKEFGRYIGVSHMLKFDDVQITVTN